MKIYYTKCTYRGKQYDMARHMNGNTYIWTDDASLTDGSFTEMSGGRAWNRVVDPWELEDVYDVWICGIYRGHDIGICGAVDERESFTICTGDRKLIDEWGMELRGRGEGYVKSVPREDVWTYWIAERKYWAGEKADWLCLTSMRLEQLPRDVEPFRRWSDAGLMEKVEEEMRERSMAERKQMILEAEQMYQEKGRLLTETDLPELIQRLQQDSLSQDVLLVRRWAVGELPEIMEAMLEIRSGAERRQILLAMEQVYQEKERPLMENDMPELALRLGLDRGEGEDKPEDGRGQGSLLRDLVCMYHGREYHLTHDEKENPVIWTEEKERTDDSFAAAGKTWWKRVDDSRELEDVHTVELFGRYRGEHVCLFRCRPQDETCVIRTADKKLAEEWAVELATPPCYEGAVPRCYYREVTKDEVEMFWETEKWYWDGTGWSPLRSIRLDEVSKAVEPMRRWADEMLLEEMKKAMEIRSKEERRQMILAVEQMFEEKGRLLTGEEDMTDLVREMGSHF